MKKRIVSLLLILAILSALFGCTSADEISGDTPDISYNSQATVSKIEAESLDEASQVYSDDSFDEIFEQSSESEPSNLTESSEQQAVSEDPEESKPDEESVSSDPPVISEEESKAAESVPTEESQEESSVSEEEKEEEPNKPDANGYYYDAESVVLYLYYYGKLPSNFVTKSELTANGYSTGSVNKYLTGGAVGGDRFYNREGILPTVSGVTYTECDIGTYGGNSRGAKRLVFSSNKRYFYTTDHYTTFTELAVVDGEVVELGVFK